MPRSCPDPRPLLPDEVQDDVDQVEGLRHLREALVLRQVGRQLSLEGDELHRQEEEDEQLEDDVDHRRHLQAFFLLDALVLANQHVGDLTGASLPRYGLGCSEEISIL